MTNQPVKLDLYTITHEIMGEWDAPASLPEITASVKANWKIEEGYYYVEADGSNVYISVELDVEDDEYIAVVNGSFRPSRDNWVEVHGGYRLEIGELYQPEEEGDDQEDEYASDEAYLGESTLAKVRRQKELVTGDRVEMFPSRTAPVPPVAPQTREGFFICTQSIEGRGQTPSTVIFSFGDEADFYRQNPHWAGVELPAPRWFGVIVMDTTQPVEGGFQLAWGGAHDCVIHAPYIYYP